MRTKWVLGNIGMLALVLLIGGFFFLTRNRNQQATVSSSVSPSAGIASSGTESGTGVGWMRSQSGWQASGTPVACPNPLVLETPVDLSKATAVLYPGQTRGGNYKPHGGFIFKGSKNEDITVTVPLDAFITKASRYIEQGEIQYFFVFIAPCGIMYRFDHLLTLSQAFQAVADTLPAPKVDDSSTTDLSPPIAVKAGDVAATAIGFKANSNVTVDFGVYDLRQKNAISSDATWASAHANDTEFAPYGVCWLDLLSTADSTEIKSLPGGDATSGKTSDYCR